jgi:hypothetical protein
MNLKILIEKYLLEIVKMFVHPMFENIKYSELDWLLVLFAEPFHILGDLDFRFLIEKFRI